MTNKVTTVKLLAARLGIALFLWQCIAYVHLMTGYFDAVASRPEYTLGFNHYAYYFLAYGSWAVFSLVLFELLKTVKQGAMLIGFSSIFLIALLLWLPSYFIIDYAINLWLNQQPQEGLIDQLIGTPNALIFFYSILYALTFFVCVCILMHKNALESQLNALKIQAQQSETQLRLLQSQLGPHFVFNCLSSISALAHTGNKNELLSAVNRVGNLLRYTIESAKSDKVFLHDELAFVDDYIALQKLRFGQRFEYLAVVDDALDYVQTPPFLVQPLIENAFVHAVAKTENTVQIYLKIRKQKAQLLVSVSNTFIDMEKPQQTFGSAISNLRSRLEATFKQGSSLIHGREAELYVCNISIPVGTTN